MVQKNVNQQVNSTTGAPLKPTKSLDRRETLTVYVAQGKEFTIAGVIMCAAASIQELSCKHV